MIGKALFLFSAVMALYMATKSRCYMASKAHCSMPYYASVQSSSLDWRSIQNARKKNRRAKAQRRRMK